jgi:hypothetical protein
MTNDIAAAIKHVEMAVAFELGEGNHLTALFCYQSAALDHPRMPNIRIRDLASPDGEHDVAPVGFKFDGEYFYVGGLDVQKTLKYKNALTAHGRR